MDLEARIAALERADIERVVLEIADYAGRTLNRFRLGRAAAVELDADGLTQEALERFLDGRWTWDPAREPSVSEFLKSRLRSLISNALTSLEYRRGNEIPRRGDGSENLEAITPSDPFDPKALDIHAAIVTAHDVLLQRVDETLAARFWSELENEVQSVADPTMRNQLEAVLIAVYAGKGYSEVAEATNLPAEVVYRRFYRLGSLAEHIAAKLVERRVVRGGE